MAHGKTTSGQTRKLRDSVRSADGGKKSYENFRALLYPGFYHDSVYMGGYIRSAVVSLPVRFRWCSLRNLPRNVPPIFQEKIMASELEELRLSLAEAQEQMRWAVRVKNNALIDEAGATIDTITARIAKIELKDN